MNTISNGILAGRVRERLRVIREAHGYSQIYLGELIGNADGGLICKHEKGTLTPSLGNIERYAKALEVPIDIFFVEDSEFKRMLRSVVRKDGRQHD